MLQMVTLFAYIHSTGRV